MGLTMVRETVSDEQRDVGRSSGILLYTLYRELQEVITASVILPRLKAISVESLLGSVCGSILTLESQYARHATEALLEDFLRHCQRENLLTRDASIKEAENILNTRKVELIDLLTGLKTFLRNADSNSNVGDLEGLTVSEVARFFWPVLFFSPSDARRAGLGLLRKICASQTEVDVRGGWTAESISADGTSSRDQF